MINLDDEVPSLNQLIEEAMSKATYVRKMPRNDEEVEKIIAMLEEDAKGYMWWEDKDEIRSLKARCRSDREFQTALNELYTKRGKNLEFYWMFI